MCFSNYAPKNVQVENGFSYFANTKEIEYCCNKYDHEFKNSLKLINLAKIY